MDNHPELYLCHCLLATYKRDIRVERCSPRTLEGGEVKRDIREMNYKISLFLESGTCCLSCFSQEEEGE